MSIGSKLTLRFGVGLLLVAALIFIPAGTWRYWQGWAYLALFFIPGVTLSFWLYRRDPQLIERRLQSKEKVTEQRVLIRLLKPVFVVVFLLAGLDYRMGWTRREFGGVPLWLTIVAQVAFLGGLLLTFWVMRVNSYASRTIQVETGQTVVSTGPYAVVRHPMYSGSILLWVATPLALGSYVALPAFALLIPFYVLRLLNEEKILRQELAGYGEYCAHTRFRLVPMVW